MNCGVLELRLKGGRCDLLRSGGCFLHQSIIRIINACQEQLGRRRLFSVYFSTCVIGYEEQGVKTANDKIQKEQQQSEAQSDGA